MRPLYQDPSQRKPNLFLNSRLENQVRQDIPHKTSNIPKIRHSTVYIEGKGMLVDYLV